MDWCRDLEPMVKRGAPLAERTTFRIGGPAAVLLEPPDEAAFASAYAAAVRSGQPVHILGGGSNLLVADAGVSGVVLSTAGLNDCIAACHGRRVLARAGMSLRRLLHWTARCGFSGLESLAGIPGTVGGAVRMNAGGRHGTIGARVAAVWCVDREGYAFSRPGREINWGYRSADIPDPILAVELLLERGQPCGVRQRMVEIMSEKRDSQPVRQRSAGCFFKNPPGDSAGRLIDSAGLKGHCVGGACVSAKHANFIVNLGGATAADVLCLAKAICECVRNRFGVELEREVCCWPEAMC